MKEKVNDGRFFLAAVMLFVAVSQILWKLLLSIMPNLPIEYSSRLAEAVMCVGAVIIWRKTDLVQPWLGMRVEKGTGRKTALTCAAVFAVIAAVYVTARLIMQNFVPEIAARPFFRTYFEIKHRRYYLVTVILEELLAKGVLQHGAEKVFPKDKWYIALAVSCAVFGMLHIQHTLYYILGSMALALISGIIYHRQGNIWASAALHFFLAFLPRCFGLK